MFSANKQDEKRKTEHEGLTGPIRQSAASEAAVQPQMPPQSLSSASTIPGVPNTGTITRPMGMDTLLRQSEAVERDLEDDAESDMLHSSQSHGTIQHSSATSAIHEVPSTSTITRPTDMLLRRSDKQVQRTMAANAIVLMGDSESDLARISRNHGTVLAGSVFHRGDDRSYEEIKAAGGFIPDKYRYYRDKPDGEKEEVELDEIESARQRVRDIKNMWNPRDFIGSWKWPGGSPPGMQKYVVADIVGHHDKSEKGKTRAGVATSASGQREAGNYQYAIIIKTDLSVIDFIESGKFAIYFYGNGISVNDSTVLGMNFVIQKGNRDTGMSFSASEFVFLTPVPIGWIPKEEVSE